MKRAECEPIMEVPPKLMEMSNEEMCAWLSRFIFEIRKVNGEEYSEMSVYQILLRYVRENGRFFF